MNNELVCHICPDGGTDYQIAKYLGEGWTKEEVSNIRGLYDTKESELLVPEEKEGKQLTSDELIEYGQKIAAYKHKIAQNHLREMKDSTRHPASAFAKLYAVPGWDGYTRNNRINMLVYYFSKALTRRQKSLERQGINKTREEICNGYTADGQKMDGQFSIFEEVFYKLYNDLKLAKGNIDKWDDPDFDRNSVSYTEEDAQKDRHIVEEYSKILNNWGALCSFARMRIRDREGIKLGNNFEYAASTTSDDFSIDGNLEDEYVLEESVREAWMTHQGEMSAFSNLGTEVRRFLSNIPVRNGAKIVRDDLGCPLYYDPISTHQYLADKLRGCKYESTMLNIFKHHIDMGKSGDPALRDIGKALLEAADVPKTQDMDRQGQPVQGKTSRKFPDDGMFSDDVLPANPVIITQLLTDMHLNMVPFTAMFSRENEMFIKRLNKERESVGFIEYLNQVQYGLTADDNSIFDEDGTINWGKFVQWYDKVIEMLPPKKKQEVNTNFVFANQEIYAQGDEGNGFWSLRRIPRIDFMEESLKALGVNLTRKEVTSLYHNKEARRMVLTALTKVATQMMDRTLGSQSALVKQLHGETLSDEETVKANAQAGSKVTMYQAINKTIGQEESQPVAEALNNIFKAIDIIKGNKGIERRVSWYDRKGKSCSRYSDMTPSYMGDLVDEIKMFAERGDGAGLKTFLMEKWGEDAFFYDKDNDKFYNKWLNEIYKSINDNGSINMDSFAATFSFTEFLGSNIDHNPVNFENFSEKNHAIAMLKNFVQLRDQTNGKSKYADYPCFILGDSGTQRFFTAKHYSIDDIIEGMRDVYKQELIRMRNAGYLKESLRQKGITDEKNMPAGFISSEDIFSTLMFLNPDFEGGKYWAIAAGKDSISRVWDTTYRTRKQNVDFLIDAVNKDVSLLDKAIESYINDSIAKFKDRLVIQGILVKNPEGKYVDKEGVLTNNAKKLYDGDVEALINDFFWNSKFATIQQIQMFTVDTSFYKSVKDLQKRYKEIYAPGKGLSLQARDYDGKLYADKNYESVRYFEDIELSAEERDEFYQTLLKQYEKNPSIIEKYKESSITDGQGYRTLKSYRAIMGMQGKWTREMERVYKRIEELRRIAQARDSKSLTVQEVQEIADSMIILQPLKPYMFTLEKVNTGNGTVLIPVQHKYAEVILIPELMPKGKLRDMAEWMYDRKVDLLASTACVKVGAFGACDIKGISDTNDLRNALDRSYPHELTYADYRIQSGVPEHLNQDQLFGTQIRKLIYSGINKSKEYRSYLQNILRNYDVDAGDLEVFIPGAGMQKLTGNNVINLYNCLIMANMFESYDNMESHASTKQQLSDMLMQNGISSSNQAADVLAGLSIIDEGENAGDFVFPIGDPTMEHDSTALLLSILKKGVNKQKIKGGSAVQMAPMGSQEDGNLREVCSREHDNVLYEEVEITWNLSYTDYNGNDVPLRFSDYCFADNIGRHNIGDLLPNMLKNGQPDIITEDDPRWEEYQSYTYKEVDGKWEPCSHDEEGAVVIRPKVEAQFPGILDMIAYRIPTERLYSAVNCKIKRFSHPTMGGVLKVPASGTTKAGFDFDIDKLYFFMKDFSQQHFTKEQVSDIWRDIYGLDEKGNRKSTDYPGLYDALKKAQEDAEADVAEQKRILGAVADVFDNSEDMAEINRVGQQDEFISVVSNWKNATIGGRPIEEIYGSSADVFRQYVEKHKTRYATTFDEYNPEKSPFENSRVSRNNMLIGLMRERLKDAETFRERYTPGGFVKLSAAALEMRIIQFSDPSDITTNGELDYSKVREIASKVVDKDDPATDPEPNYDYSDPSTVLIYNQQNQIAAKLIGIFANQNTHHVFCSALERLALKDAIAFGDHPDGLGNFLHKGDDAAEIDVNMAELLAAAVDAVKDPVLNYLNLNLVTADSAAVLFRLGYSQKEVGLLLNQPIIKDLCEEVANNGTTVEVAINKISKQYGATSATWKNLKYNPATTATQNLANNIMEGRDIRENGRSMSSSFKTNQLQVLKLFNQIQGVASEMNSFVQATRFTAANSIGSTWGDVIAVMQRTQKFADDYEGQSSSDDEEGGPKLIIVPHEGSDKVLNMDSSSLDLSPEQYAEQNYDNPIAFEQCMLDLVRKTIRLFGKYYPHFTPLYENVRTRLSNMTKYGTLDADTINSIHRDMMVFLLGMNEGSDFDGETYISDHPDSLAAQMHDSDTEDADTNREFYTEEFPKILAKVLSSEEGRLLAESSPFFGRLRPGENGYFISGVGGMQSMTADEIIGAWDDAVRSADVVSTDDGESYRVRDLAMGMYFHNFYRLGFNFHGTSTMHLAPTNLKLGLNATEDGLSYVNFVKKVIDGTLDLGETDQIQRMIDLFAKQYILNHLDNYKFVFTANNNTPVGKYLFELTNLESGKAPDSFTLDCQEISDKGYYNMFTVKGRAGEQYVAFKPVIALKVGNTKIYYMAQSGSATEFNVASKAAGQMKYVRVNPQGERGRSLAYFNQENFNQQLEHVDLPFLKSLKKFFHISKGGLQEVIKHMQGMGIRVHTLREMEIFMEQHPELFDDALFLTAYHASAADFDRFDLSFIRNGETGAGDAVFGRGVYVGSELVARGYGEQSFKWKNARRKKIQRTVNTRFGQVNILTSNNNVNAGTIRLKALWSNSGNTDIYLVYYSGRRCFITVPVIVNKETVNVPLEYDPILFNEFEEVDKFGFKWENGKLVYEDQVWDEGSRSFKVVSKTPVKLAVTEAENGQPVTFESLKGFLQDIYDNLPTLTKLELEYLRPSYNLYTTTIPNDTGNNYLSWDEQLSQEIINTIIHGISNEVLNKLGYVGESPLQWLSEYTGEMLYHDLVKYYTKRGMSQDEAEIATNELLYSAGIVGNKVSVNYGHQHKTKSEKNYVLFHENDVQINSKDVQYLRTPSGEVYGFVYQGEIYMDETKLDPQVPIHEYTHIWDEAVMQSNPRLWERGKRLLRDSRNSVLRNLWNEIAESDAYGKKWQAQGKTEEEIDNLIAGEVHARLVGEKGAELLELIEKNTGGRGLVARLKRWMKDVFRHIGKTFGTWTDEALNELSLNDFINMPLRDFVDGVNPVREGYSAEMQSIKSKAIADGTFMKAPNGNSTNLTERLWLQVRTKAFKDWFGDWENDPENSSKVVDENGEPLVVYHGGPHNISAFKLPKNSVKISFDSTRNLEWARQQGYRITQDVIDKYNNGEEVDVIKPVGVYFAADDVTARSYFGRRNEADTALYQVFLNIRNPHLANMNGKQMHDDSATVGLLKYAKDNSNDGVIIDNVRDYGPNDEERINWDTGHFAIEPTTDYIIFNSNQVKSATDNNGEFSTENNDINFMVESDSEDTGNYQSEFNSDEVTYDEGSSYNSREVFSNEEWDTLYEQLVERSPLMAKQAEQGFFSKQDLIDMLTEPEETNQSILQDIKQGLNDGSIKPMTIDENQKDIPLCM